MQINAAGIITTLFIAIILDLAGTAHAQQTPDTTDWRLERQALERVIADDLQSVANWCRSKGMPNHAAQTFAWHQNRDTERQYIFLPSEKRRAIPKDPQSKLWLAKMEPVLREHSERIFKLAGRAADANAGAVAYQFLHEVLYYSPDHEQARAMLGHRKTEKGWRVSSDRLKVKRAANPHDVMGWEAGSYLFASTPHFNIASRADETTTRFLANKLERWHDVWRQVMFEYWSRPESVKRWFSGKGKARQPKTKFDVVFFADRQQYLDALSARVKGIESSTGYYNASNKISYFYASEDVKILETWHHELTHQLFQESVRSAKNPFDDGFIWLGEGIAMYFESLTDFGPYVTMGGFEARRLQFSRIRLLREGFYVGTDELSRLGRKGFQQRKDMPLLYSQSAGLAHMMMNDANGKDHNRLIAFLKLLYQGKLKPGTFNKVLGKSFEEIDEQYKAFLAINSNQVESYLSRPFLRTELALPRGRLSADAFSQVGKCENLQWLDLTANDLTGSKLKPLLNCKDLDKLFMTNCAVDAESLNVLRSLDLTELDLSGSSVSDNMLPTVALAGELTLLRLTKTRITDAGLKSLAKLSKLEFLDLTGTKVTQAGVAQLQAKLPELEIKN